MGLIDMARKSGSKLVYQFEKINDLYSYYTLTVKVEDRVQLIFTVTECFSIPFMHNFHS